jgi:DNA uptake protein ComE-like DNA-binding protein
VKQGPLESIEELALVIGATREILYGEDENMNGALDANEDDNDKSLPADNGNGKLDPGILEYVTVFSREPNTQADGTARINVATPTPSEELTTLLKDKFGNARAQEIAVALGAGPPGQPVRSVLEFFVKSGMKEDEFGQIVDAITTTTGDYRPGLINVNTASETVLACIPGIGTDKASSLVAARLSRTAQDTNIAWVVPIIGAQSVPQAGPFVTGQSWQVSADVAAVGRHGRGWRRTRFVIDQSTRTPRIIYRRNMAGLGWALGSDVRETFATKKEIR